jgi:GDP-mannose transporter
MIISSVVAGYADVTSSKASRSASGSGSVSILLSYSWMLLNCLSTAALTLTIRSTQRKVNFTDFDTVYYNNMISIPMLLIMSLLCEQGEGGVVWEKYFGKGALENSSEFTSLISGILISSICTFMIAYCTSWCIRVTGATTYR